MEQSLLLTLSTIAAIIIGPSAALWIQRRSEKQREQRNRKLVVFKELMSTRSALARLSHRHVDALNAVQVEFSEDGGAGDKLILEAWRLYMNHLNTPCPSNESGRERWGEKTLELLIDLLYEMSRSLPVPNVDKVALKNCYSPQGHFDLGVEEWALRKQVLEITAGRRPIWITLDEPPPPPS